MERDVEIKINREGEYVVGYDGVTAVRQKKQINNEMYNYLYAKFIGDDRSLRVYVDEENDRYYIDVFAARALGLRSYNDTCNDYDNGIKLFEISKETLKMLQEIFKNRIFYVQLHAKKQDTMLSYTLERRKPLPDSNDNLPDDLKDMFDNDKFSIALGDEIEMLYDNYKAEKVPESFEDYLAQNGYENNDYENNNTNDDTISKFRI